METHSSDKGTGGGSGLAFLVGFAVLQIVGWYIFPMMLYGSKTQPIDFSHKTHVEGAGISCDSCHSFRADGTFTGIPKIAKCKECHEAQVGQSPEEAKLVNDYIAKGKEVPWLGYAHQPDCVYFSHAAHVKLANMDCTTCHGNHGETDHLRPYEYNRITKYSRDIWGKRISGFKFLKKNQWETMKMIDCGDCHAKKHASNACFVCHK